MKHLNMQFGHFLAELMQTIRCESAFLYSQGGPILHEPEDKKQVRNVAWKDYGVQRENYFFRQVWRDHLCGHFFVRFMQPAEHLQETAHHVTVNYPNGWRTGGGGFSWLWLRSGRRSKPFKTKFTHPRQNDIDKRGLFLFPTSLHSSRYDAFHLVESGFAAETEREPSDWAPPALGKQWKLLDEIVERHDHHQVKGSEKFLPNKMSEVPSFVTIHDSHFQVSWAENRGGKKRSNGVLPDVRLLYVFCLKGNLHVSVSTPSQFGKFVQFTIFAI